MGRAEKQGNYHTEETWNSSSRRKIQKMIMKGNIFHSINFEINNTVSSLCFYYNIIQQEQ